MEKIEVKDLEFVSTGGDAGITYNIVCPECKETIKVAEHGWWDTQCECGYDWNLILTAYGTK